MAVVGGALLGVLSLSFPAHACSPWCGIVVRDGSGGGPGPVPPDGAIDVPLNVKPRIVVERGEHCFGDRTSATMGLVHGTVPVSAESSRATYNVTVDDVTDSWWMGLSPDELLEPFTAYEVMVELECEIMVNAGFRLSFF